MTQENVASKLHKILSQTKKYPETKQFRDVWSEIFSIPRTDTSEMIKRYASVIDLYKETLKLIEDHPKLNNDTNKKFLEYVGLSLGTLNINTNMGQFHGYLTSEVMTALHFISENISFVYHLEDSLLTEELVNELMSDIKDLIDKITFSDLPIEVKKLLVQNLNVINNSLHSYFITGIDGVTESLGQAIGTLFINRQAITPEIIEDDNVTGVFKFMGRLNEIISTISGAKELAAPIITYFLTK